MAFQIHGAFRKKQPLPCRRVKIGDGFLQARSQVIRLLRVPLGQKLFLLRTPEYNDYFCNQLTELLTQYGEIFYVWFDNACGEGKNGKKQDYDFPRYFELIHRYQPGAVIFNDFGPGPLAKEGSLSYLYNTENELGSMPTILYSKGLTYVPSEIDMSIRPGWFWHPDEAPQSLERLLQTYL